MRKRSEFGNEVYTIELATEYNWEDGVVIPFDPWADNAQVIDVYVLEQLSNPYDLSSVERTVFRLDEAEHNADIWYNYVPIDSKFREDWQPVDGMPDYYADAPNQEVLVRYHIDYVMDQYDYEENWEDEHAFMAKRKAMRRSAAIKNRTNVRRAVRRRAQLQEGYGTAISYANVLNHIEAVMREAYDAHDLNSYNALKRSGDELYEAIIAEGYTISYDQSTNSYVVSV